MELVLVPLRELSVTLGQLYGCIWFETNGRALPERGWNERPLMTMGMWTGGLRNVLEFGEDFLYFFEGHFSVRVRLDGRRVRAEFCDKDDSVISEELMSWKDFVGALIEPLPAFGSELRRKGLDTYGDDTAEFIELLEDLRDSID